MKRRNFIKKACVAGTVLALFPTVAAQTPAERATIEWVENARKLSGEASTAFGTPCDPILILHNGNTIINGNKFYWKD